MRPMADTPKSRPSDLSRPQERPADKRISTGRGLVIPTEPGLEHPNTLVAPVDVLVTPKRAVLTVLAGADIGRVLDVAGMSITFGRRRTCSHMISDPSVSGLHARITTMSGMFVLSDEGSTNGTFLNGIRISEPATLTDGDRLHLGRVLLRFALVDEAERLALKRMYETALHDTLTGLFNRKHLDERIEAEIAFARRHKGHELSILMVDVDHFKSVNDTYGHLAGDAVLRAVAASILGTVRAEDFVARYGGEEFVIVARDAGVPAARTLAERVREMIAQGVVTYDGSEIRVTASVGVASMMANGQSLDKTTLLETADERLYEAKRAGRNRVVGP
jgi:two-component system, cell cycle response regulator